MPKSEFVSAAGNKDLSLSMQMRKQLHWLQVVPELIPVFEATTSK